MTKGLSGIRRKRQDSGFGIDANFLSSMFSVNEKEQYLSDTVELAIAVSGIGIWEWDPLIGQVYWNSRMLQIYGITEAEFEQNPQCWDDCLHPEDKQRVYDYSAKCYEEEIDINTDYRIIRSSGEIRHIRSIARKAKNSGNLIGVNIDLTDDYLKSQQLEEAHRQLQYEALHDVLTSLANRRDLTQCFQEMQASANAESSYFALMHIDLDRFKHINDTFGHASGDAVLVRTAQVLNSLASDNDFIARVGGDEFVILSQFELHKFAPEQNIETVRFKQLAQSIVTCLSAPFAYENLTLNYGASIGIAICAGQELSLSQLMINADIALYEAKNKGRNQVRCFDNNASEFKIERLIQRV